MPRKSRILLCEGEGEEGQGSLKRGARMAQKGSLQAGIGRSIVIYERTASIWVTWKGLRNNCGQERMICVGSSDSVSNRQRIKMSGPFLPCCFKAEKGEWQSGPVGRRRMGLDKTKRQI